LGNREPFVLGLARSGLIATLVAAVCALGTYVWSYRKHSLRALESRTKAHRERPALHRWSALVSDWMMPDPRRRAVFSFVGRTLLRSRSHRIVFIAFAGLAIAMIFESFVALALGPGFRGFGVRTFALQQVAISAPLSLSLFVLAGYRYLFRLPVELGANWVFRINESGNCQVFLQAVRRILLWYGVLPVAVLTLPLLLQTLGLAHGLLAAVFCLLPSLVLMEFLGLQSQGIPFTSSYLPGQNPLIQTFLIYGVSITSYVSALSGIFAASLHATGATATRAIVILLGLMLAAWLRIRHARVEAWRTVSKLDFEELPVPAVMRLCIERD
ncbi:MAG: hypothetical protein M3Z32_11625, partial [Acidobacteriota bacterium]|nr:hypothetical protein [Acidobacteriota bacterium]